MSTLSFLAILAGLLGVVVFLARSSGKAAAINEVNKDNAKVADEQLKAANDRPDSGELADKLRNGQF